MSRTNTNQGSRRTLVDEYPVKIVNTTEFTITPHALVGIVGSSGVGVNDALRVSVGLPLPNGQTMVNGPLPLRAGKTGNGRYHSPMKMRVDFGSILGDELGPHPTVPSFLASDSGSGYKALGSAASGLVLVERLSAGTSSDTPPLRRFELTANKLLAATSATVNFFEDDGTLTGSDVTIYCPAGLFAGRVDSYVGTERGFQGVALLRTDLGAVEPDRWEIVVMERFAEWAVVQWSQSGGNWTLVNDAFGGDDFNWRRPAANAAVLAVSDTAELIGRALVDGEKAIARLTMDPDTPTYQLHGLRSEDRRIAVDDSDTIPLTLINKLLNVSTYDDETDRLVEFEVVDDTVDKIRAFVNVSDFGTSLDTGTRVVQGVCDTTLEEHTDDIVLRAGTIVVMDGVGTIAGPLTVLNLYNKLYQEDALIYAAYSQPLDAWFDITPTEGEVLTAIVDTDIPAAVWDGGSQTLTTGVFSATLLISPLATPGPYALTAIEIIAENCARRNIPINTEEILIVKLRWENQGYKLIWDETVGEKQRLLRGLADGVAGAGGSVEPGDTTFKIDNVVALASGIDPTGGVSATEVTVNNIWGNAYTDNEPVDAVWNGTGWDALQKDNDRLVAADATDTSPASLIEKLTATGTYDSETDRLVEFEVVDDSGKKVRGFVNVAGLGGGGGGSLTAGCGIDATALASDIVKVDVTQMDGVGLDVDTEEGACLFNVNLCEALEAKAIVDGKTSGTYVLGVVDGVCTWLEIKTGCGTCP